MRNAATGDHWRRYDDWLPVVGDVVCVHPPDSGAYAFNYLARVIQTATDIEPPRFYVHPIYSPRMNARTVHALHVEPTIVTFDGHICLRCRKGSIR